MTLKLILAFVIAFAVSAVVGFFLVPYLKRIKAGQSIKENGPTWHMSKQGTPTMGGLMFIAAIAVVCLSVGFECMAEGYEVDALHYLVKPVPAEKLRAVLDRAAARLAVEPPSVVIACEEGNVKLYESELLYAESFLHDLVLHTTGPDYRIRESISAFAGRLSADFFRTHRSYLVNLKAVVRIGRTSILLRGGAEVPLARGKYDAINRAFIDRN